MKRLLLLLILVCILAPVARAAELGDEERLHAIETILTVAYEELGYTEGKGGYTKYGEWAGGAYKEWCSEFVTWCVDQADLRMDSFYLGSLYPIQDTCEQGFQFFLADGRYVSTTGDLRGWGEQWYLSDGVWVADRPYIPERGDCLYIEWYKYNRLDHVALVDSVSQDETGTYEIHTIEGNNPDAVAQFVYAIDDESLRGYGTTQRLVGTTMKKGCQGALVEALQNTLVEQGYLGEKWVTAEYGENTEGAIRRVQAQFGLEETGIADRDTQKALEMW